MNTLAVILAFLSFFMGALLFIRAKAPMGFPLPPLKIAAASLAPVWAAVGVTGAVIGWLSGAPLAVAGGLLGAVASSWYFWRVTRAAPGFSEAFGSDWERKIPASQQARMLKHRWSLFSGLKNPRQPSMEQNLVFATVPGTDRQLLCDLWQPPAGVTPTGSAYIFSHGSAWSMLDKDFGTRPFFQHLANQGHLVMDVAYRLCPEVDIYGMVGDVKRAVAWMKANASHFGANPDCIILGGASAGGHLSMLVGYAPELPQFTPPELQGVDLSVRGIISFYGPSDLCAVYQHTRQERMVGLPKIPTKNPNQRNLSPQNAGRLDVLLGYHLSENSQVYAQASPVNYVHPGCPPTLLIQGAHDLITPVEATQVLHQKLLQAGVPTINIVFPCTDHAFDLLVPGISPVTQSAVYAVDRFLAVMASR
jgi:acetyl esterase/lipase